MQRELVTTESVAPAEQRKPTMVLVRPRPTPARTGRYFQRQAQYYDLPYIIQSASRSRYLAVDYETRGTDYSWGYERHLLSEPHRGVSVVGVALAWDRGSAYIHWQDLSRANQLRVLDLLTSHQGLIAHNVPFDGGISLVLREYLTGERKHLNWAACTLALYRLIANEGWKGQQHGLKAAMTDVLQWEDTNEAGIDEWLVTHGYYRGNRRKDESPDALLENYREGTLSPDKGEMWRVPKDILGKYAVLDAEACYLLYTEHLLPILQRFPALETFYTGEFLPLILLHIDQYLHGILMDRPALLLRQQVLSKEIADLELQFRNHPEVAQHIQEIESGFLAELTAKEPPRYLKPETLGKEPPRYKKDGTQSVNWEKWCAKRDRVAIPVQSKVWENWKERYDIAASGGNPEYLFNLSSGPQMRDLLYTRLGHEIRITTDSGLAGTGSDALRHMGEIGKILVDREELTKELSYIDKYIELTEHRSTIHPSFNLPGPCTGRLSSREPNLQQVKKKKAMMDLFLARPGRALVDLDFRALENVVAAELSGCPNLYNLYGDDVPENDVHLFLVAHIRAWMNDIAATGYTPYNPPPGSVGKAKKECKGHRNKAKTCVYACQYGGGAQKVYDTLVNDGVDISFEEVKELHTTYWELFARLKQYSYELQDQWWETTGLSREEIDKYKKWSKDRNRREQIPKDIGGYILNGLGRPMCITYEYLKDALSRCLQSTGHDLLVKYVTRCLVPELYRQGIPWSPWIIDLHDSATIETEESYAQQCAEIFTTSLVELNKLVRGKIKLGGTPTSGVTMTDIKEPDE